MKKNLISLLMVCACFISVALPAFAQMVDRGAVLKQNEQYAAFLTQATYEGTAWRECRLMTSLCPDRCGHSGNIATFSIDKNIVYAKYNEYGDEPSEQFMIMIDKGDETAPLIDKKWYDVIKSLDTGDKILLAWDHLYVTVTDGDFVSKYPERPITFIHPLTDKQAQLIPSFEPEKDSEGNYGKLARYYVALAHNAGNFDEDNPFFQIDRHLYTYYYGNIATMEYLVGFSIKTDDTIKGILDIVGALNPGDYALIAFRRDGFQNGIIVDTPLLVLPESVANAEELMK